MKILSICIPTYNRNESLIKLTEDFIKPALNSYSQLIEVIITDNSDDDIAKENEKVIDSRVKYSKNDGNIGYSGNIGRCIELATGKFIWIIADDDKIVWNGFTKLITRITNEKHPVDVIFTPVITYNIHKEKIIVNDKHDWSCEKRCHFNDILKKGNLPFLFIASAIVRNEFDSKRLHEVINLKNDYLHALIYYSKLSNNSDVVFLDNSIVEYGTSSEEVRFSIDSISTSINFLINYIYEYFSVKIKKSVFYSEHLKWLLYHRGGISKVYKGDEDRLRLILKLPHSFSFKNTVLCLLLLLPKRLIKYIFVSFYSIKAMRTEKRISIKILIEQMRRYNNLI